MSRSSSEAPDEDFEQDSPDDSERRLHALMTVAFDGVIVSENGVVIGVGKRLLDISGYTMQEVIGRPVTDFVAAEYHETIRQRRSAGTEGRLEAVGVLKDGRTLPIEIVTMNYDWRGRIVQVTALRDISEKRRLEEQVRQAQKMESLGLLASGVAHDFNNILTVIRSCADLLLCELAEPLRNDARDIRLAADAGAALTRQLLVYGRQMPPDPKPIDLNALVRSSASMLRRLISAPVYVVVDLDTEAGLVLVDASQLQQVILNLAINARDAMPKGGRLMLRTRRVVLDDVAPPGTPPLPAGTYVALAVRDSGTGIPPALREQIFEPFFTTKQPGGHTGLGLAVVKGIVEQNRAFITVDSTTGEGTTFTVYFPAVQGD